MTPGIFGHKVVPGIFIALLFSTSIAGEAPYRGIPSVIDGDTIEIHGQRIRLHGIDAPESSQICNLNNEKWRCGQAAALALSGQLGRRTITCKPLAKDRYKRIVAECFLGHTSINGVLPRFHGRLS
ncbi:MAG: thermonuclease family protein [Candidatus Thiodiazotropha sp.]